MIRNQNGYWMSPDFYKMFAPDDGGSAGGAPESGASAEAAGDLTVGAESAENATADNGTEVSSSDAKDAEIARLQAEISKVKNAFDKASKEAGEARKALKAKMTAEEIAAKEKEEADEAQKNRILELEKQVAKTATVKSVMGKLGLDEDAAGNLADHLFGAADIDNALLEIQKAWQAKEKALRLEFGKIPPPGSGADSNSPEAQAIARAANFGKAQKAVNDQAQKALGAYIR